MQVDGLCFAYPQQQALFSGWSARIPCGVTLLRGGEGRGKTTLLRLLAGELQPQTGKVHWHGMRLGEQSQSPSYPLMPTPNSQHVFRVDPRTEAFEHITPTAYFASLSPRFSPFDDRLVNRLADGLGLTPHLHKPMYMLSTGSKCKVWLVAAFASGALLTLLDEPFAALDKPSINFVMAQLADMAQHPARIFVVANYEGLDDVPLAGVMDLGA